MQETIKVHVVKYPTRANLVMRYVDPDSGRQVTRSSGTTNALAANRAAAKWEAELREGRYTKRSRLAWFDFRDQLDRDLLDGLKANTAAAYSASLNVFERKCKPGRLAEVTTAKLTAFVTMLRDDRLAPATIARHLRTLKVAMRWAHRQGLLLKLPEFAMPKQAKGMKGRPISGEEFDRLLRAVPKGVKARPTVGGGGDVAPWRFYLRGLWYSGCGWPSRSTYAGTTRQGLWWRISPAGGRCCGFPPRARRGTPTGCCRWRRSSPSCC